MGIIYRALAAVLAVSAIGPGCRHQSPPRPARQAVRIATAFAPLSTRLADEYRRTLPDADIQLYTATTSKAVVEAIEADAVDLGIVHADSAYFGYWGTHSDGPPQSHIRGVSLLQPLPAYLLVRAGSGIRQVSDLRGRVLALGPKDSSSWTLGQLVIRAFGLDRTTIAILNTREQAAAQLREGSVDALFLPGYVYPDEAVYSVIRQGAYLVPIEGPAVERLRHEYPFVRLATIPRDIYPGQDRIIPTVGIDMVMVCRRDLDERLVYELTEQLFNALPRVSGVEASLRFLNVDETPATPIPLHAGAARYFRARELAP